MSQPPSKRPDSRILVVEDDASVSELQRRVLQRRHHEVDVVGSAGAALEKLASGAYAAVVLDYRLSDGDGWPVLDAARVSNPAVPVVVVTGAGDERVAAEAIHRGAADYLVKSNEFSAMLPDAVERVVRIAAGERATALLASVVAATDDAVVTATLAGTISSWNLGAARLFGRSADVVIGTPLAALFTDGDLAARLLVEATVPPDPARESGSLAPCAAACVTPAGQRRELALTVSVVRNDRGDATALALLGHDVTAQRATENALRDSDARYASLLAHIPDLIWRTSLEGETLFVSPAVERVTGYTAAEVYAGGLTVWPGRVAAGDAARIQAALAALAGGHPADIQFQYLHKAGHAIWLHMRGVRVQLADGSYVAEGIASDITAARRLQEQFLRSQRLEAVGQLTSGIAHDFNNLLSAIIGGSVFIADGLPDGHRARADALDIKAAAQSAARLTQQLLAFSRKQRMTATEVDLGEALAAIERLLRRTLSEDILLRIDCAPGVPPVLVDGGQLQQVILNLVVNARDAMPAGGTLTLTTAMAGRADAGVLAGLGLEPGDYACLSVSDTGHGMDPATLARIFEPFFTTKEVGRGSGLGLSTCHGIVHQSGGTIEVDSHPGLGTTFRVYLPCVREQANRSVPATPVRGAGHERPARVLVVEDDPGVLRTVSRILRGEGHEVVTATGCADAAAVCAAESGRLHLVVSDVVMPDGRGPDVVDALRAMQPDLRAILMSGYADHAALRDGALPAGVAFLQKPFEPGDLAALVRHVLAR